MERQTGLPINPYLLLTPGPLSTSIGVRQALLKDWCTWDSEYNQIVQQIRGELVGLATNNPDAFTSVLMQGSGTFSVESVIGSAMPDTGCLLVLANGAYGERIAQIAEKLKLSHHILAFSETEPVDPSGAERFLLAHPEVTHVAMVHCETTTGILNNIREVSRLVKSLNKVFILDAMSSFGGIPMDIDQLGIDFLISSANKCIQGVPGFGFIIARKEAIELCEGNARSLSLDLYDQWKTMEDQQGKWRFTSPTHTVRAFVQALDELRREGGVELRYKRYKNNQALLTKGMKALGFDTLLQDRYQSPFITAFLYPESELFSFEKFYDTLKLSGFVIYPGKVTSVDTFRIGNIGEVYERDILNLLSAIKKSIYW